jgi:hypothetical protein
MPRVDIGNGGRGGSITYGEGLHTASLYWEFALSPALAIITGPRASEWDRACPWAVGRQAEIFEHVAAEVVRQKAPGSRYEIDLDAGTVTILEARRRVKGRKRRGSSPRGPLDAVGELADDEVVQLIDLMLRDEMSGPIVDGLAQIDHPKAHAAVDEASRHHLSVDVRLAAAEALHARGALADLERVLTRELRVLNRPSRRARPGSAARGGASHAGGEAGAPLGQLEPDRVRHGCARLLLKLVGGPGAVAAMSAVLPGLDLHTTFFQRKAAFDAVCQSVGMTLDPS